jgi:hypothetical protein
MLKLLPREFPFFEEREFGNEEEKKGLYDGYGGNIVNYLTGMVQLYLPGVASSSFRAVTAAHHYAEWDVPKPNLLGMRCAEYLSYHKKGRLGTHDDSGSLMTLSVALSNPDDYEGGYFHLERKDALFKVPRLSGIVFLAKSVHGITEIFDGERKVFVTEIWDNDDLPVSWSPRRDSESFELWKEERRKVWKDNGVELMEAPRRKSPRKRSIKEFQEMEDEAVIEMSSHASEL